MGANRPEFDSRTNHFVHKMDTNERLANYLTSKHILNSSMRESDGVGREEDLELHFTPDTSSRGVLLLLGTQISTGMNHRT